MSISTTIRGDLFGGVTAAVVALPLALAFGVASGLGPMAGLYGAVAVGFFAAVFGGTSAQVSGPTGPMTIIVAAVVAQYADRLETAFAIVFLGGAIQALFGLLRVGKYVSYTPYSVISGFMSGIGVIIILLEILPFLGLEAVGSAPIDALLALPVLASQANIDALLIAVTSLTLMIFWPKNLNSIVPAPLIALLAGTCLSLTLAPSAPIIGSVPTGLPDLHLPIFSILDLPAIIQPAFVLALLGSIDSLLTSLVADSITRTQHDSNRELIGQGIGNMAAGILGALPGAGATMRTVVNVRAGGHSKLSGVIHAAILLALVLGLGPLTEKIPLAALAGILMKVGWDIIDWGYLTRVHVAPREKVVVMFVTLGLTVFVDLITAVAVGLVLAGFVTAKWMESEELKGLSALTPANDLLEKGKYVSLTERVNVISLSGRFSYASARQLTRRVGALMSGYEVIILDFTHAAGIDTSAAMAIDEMIQSAQSHKIHCVLAGISSPSERVLESLGVLSKLTNADVVVNLEIGLRRAHALIDKQPDVLTLKAEQ